MPCYVPRSSVVRRRQPPRIRSAPLPLPLAVLDLSIPGERQAHDFLLRATSRRDRMWTLIVVRRIGDLLLCVVRWAYPNAAAKPFALAEVSLTETAVCWRDYPTADAAQAEMERRGAMSAAHDAAA